MSLSFININFFRNFIQTKFQTNSAYNIFYGNNGIGKTSLLEAINYLITGRSFRTHLLRRIINHNYTEFTLFGEINHYNIVSSIGIKKSILYGKQIKFSGKNISSNIDLIKLIPIQILTHNGYLLFLNNKLRRQFIDWGIFHLDNKFLDLWRNFEFILKQRNVAIRNKINIDSIKAWDKSFTTTSIDLYKYRKQYVENLSSTLNFILQKLQCNFKVNISYKVGWDINQDLSIILHKNLVNDLKFGYTIYGAHRSDLSILVNKIPAKDILSRGQQKLLFYALQIAQGTIICKNTDKNCIYLIDDILAELDLQKCKLVVNVLKNFPNIQIFATGLSYPCLKEIFLDLDKSISFTNMNSFFDVNK